MYLWSIVHFWECWNGVSVCLDQGIDHKHQELGRPATSATTNSSADAATTATTTVRQLREINSRVASAMAGVQTTRRRGCKGGGGQATVVWRTARRWEMTTGNTAGGQRAEYCIRIRRATPPPMKTRKLRVEREQRRPRRRAQACQRAVVMPQRPGGAGLDFPNFIQN